MTETSGSGQIPTNLRLLAVIEEVARQGAPVAPSRVGEALGLPKATIHRLFLTAETEGYLQRDLEGRAFVLGPRLRHLAAQVQVFDPLRAARAAVLRQVTETVGETCNLAAPDREGMVYLDRVETSWPLRIQLPVGSQVPFHCTASGKMFLSTLPPAQLRRLLSVLPLPAHGPNGVRDARALEGALEDVRRQGFGTDDQEFLAGMAAVAVPVQDRAGRLLATLSVHAPLQRTDLQTLIGAVPTLQEGAAQLQGLILGDGS